MDVEFGYMKKSLKRADNIIGTMFNAPVKSTLDSNLDAFFPYNCTHQWYNDFSEFPATSGRSIQSAQLYPKSGM